MKKLFQLAALTAALLATGCAPNHHITRAESMKVTTNGNALMKYAGQIRDAIKDEMPPVNFAGMSCTIRINLARDGMVLSVNSEGGDPFLCEAAISAVRNAKIPPAPTEELYQIFRNAPLDFKY